MAAIARKAAPFSVAILLLFIVSSNPAVAADASSDARAQIGAVAQALTSQDAAEAIAHFSKSCADYDKLRHYFEGLSAFEIDNRISVTDEQDNENSVDLTITWDLTLTGMTLDQTKHRSAEIHATIAREGSKWRIVQFAPIEIFNPQVR